MCVYVCVSELYIILSVCVCVLCSILIVCVLCSILSVCVVQYIKCVCVCCAVY